ncbi:MAG: tyrosine-type recombinase/integrase [Mogibacterium sp.]|nr:tyrosine-type recombinase/integrase [Mogibacterium sp.]
MNNDEVQLKGFEKYLITEEKAPATCEKYLHEVRGLFDYIRAEGGGGESDDGGDSENRVITAKSIVAYKNHLIDKGFSPSTVNGELSAIRAYLKYIGREEIRIHNMRQQRRSYISERRMLERSDYEKLLKKAVEIGEEELELILESLCATGMRVSELKYLTKEAVSMREARISLKGKTRTILIPGKLRNKLHRFAKKRGIEEGAIFINRRGSPLHRSYIWALMKKLAVKAGVDACKVFPHNLRRLFARCFYRARHDIAKLADVLGHSSIDTTRIYIAETYKEHERIMEELALVT